MDDIAKADVDEYICNTVKKQKTVFPRADKYNIKVAQEKQKELYAREKVLLIQQC